MNRIIQYSKNTVALQLLAVAFLFVFLATNSLAQPGNSQGPQGPKCVYRDLDSNKIIHYDCDRFQSKGDLDSITPQVAIYQPSDGDVIDLSELNTNGIGQMLLPIKIFISPEYVVDFGASSNAVTQYAVLPQEDLVGHAHAYVHPVITFVTDPATMAVTDVNFLADTRSDHVGGFCVFQSSVTIASGDQMLSVNCPLQGNPLPGEYRVTVDLTANSHDPRTKEHPRDVIPGAEVQVTFVP
jgi:hypothetical protein